jgi:hypothetical protein
VILSHVACHDFRPPLLSWQPYMHLITLSSFWGVLYY